MKNYSKLFRINDILTSSFFWCLKTVLIAFVLANFHVIQAKAFSLEFSPTSFAGIIIIVASHHCAIISQIFFVVAWLFTIVEECSVAVWTPFMAYLFMNDSDMATEIILSLQRALTDFTFENNCSLFGAILEDLSWVTFN